MAVYSKITKYILNGMFSNTHFYDTIKSFNNTRIGNTVTLENVKYLCINTTGVSFDIPVYYNNKVPIYISGNISTISIPLIFDPFKINYASLYKSLLLLTTSPVIQHIQLAEKFTYYIGKGIILNDDLEVMMMACISYKYNTNNRIKHKIYINTNLYNAEQDPLAKWIIKNVISFYSSSYYTGLMRHINTEIVVANLEGLLPNVKPIEAPTVPLIMHTMNTRLKQLFRINKESIYRCIDDSIL